MDPDSVCVRLHPSSPCHTPVPGLSQELTPPAYCTNQFLDRILTPSVSLTSILIPS